jgi:PAS domain S-box-containing protein
MLDSNGVIVSVNQAWREFAMKNSLQGSDFGIGQNYVEMCERTTGDCAEEAHAVAAGIREVIEGRATHFTLAYPCESPQHHYWFRLIVLPLVEKGSGGVMVMHADITDAKLNEAYIARLAAIVDCSDDAISSKDLTSIVTSWNHGAEKIFGYTASEMIGTSILRIIPSDRQFEEETILHKIKNGENLEHFETVRQAKDGRLIYVSITASPIKDANGKIIGASAIARDISEGKRVESKLRLQSSALEAASNAIVISNRNGEIEWANAAFTITTGYGLDDIIGRNPRFLKSGKQDAKFYQDLWQTITSGKVWHGEIINRHKNGSLFTEEMTITPIRDDVGEIAHYIAVKQDITERKKIEAQYLRAQRMESIGTLAGGVAHDLNNILAPILMSIDILKTTAENPQAIEILKTIELSAKRGADIVRQVLSFARGLEGERIEIQPKHLLKDLENIIKDTFPKDIRLEFSIPKNTWTILGDPTQVHQILLNLSVNARDAMPNGGSLKLEVENCELDDQYAAMNPQAKPGRYVTISVTDSGTGIPRDIIDQIFDPFFTTKELNKGTGLGLSTVMAVVKSHHGMINVYSEPGKGSTFKVYLPAAVSSDAATKELSEQASLPRGNGELILVVDDEASILTIASQTLQGFGYRALTATDGADAIAIYAQNRNEIAVVITDMSMPVLDGPATIHALLRINPEIKIIAMSGLNANGSFVKQVDARVKHFIVKPYSAGFLLKLLRKVLEEA